MTQPGTSRIALYSISSSLHSGLPDVGADPFITGIEKALGEEFEIFGEDFGTYADHPLNVIYVRTGGTEGIFKSLALEGDIRLLTSGRNNSLAAAMEILSYVNSHGGRGEILHGEAGAIATRLRSGSATRTDVPGWIRPLPDIDLGGSRLGVIGRPSDWLVSSDVDYASAARKLGVELVDIDIAELVRNQSEPGLCRTQVVLNAPGAASYFLTSSLANHHIIVPGTLDI